MNWIDLVQQLAEKGVAITKEGAQFVWPIMVQGHMVYGIVLTLIGLTFAIPSVLLFRTGLKGPLYIASEDQFTRHFAAILIATILALIALALLGPGLYYLGCPEYHALTEIYRYIK